MSRTCLALILAGLTIPAAPAQQLSPFTFRIKANECKTTQGNPRHVLTGFRVKNQVGIVTALHGVVGCAEIWAANTYGLSLQKPLQIADVDLDHDLALLWSEELSKLSAEGLECRCVSAPCAAAPAFCRPASELPAKNLRVEGMPRGNNGLGGQVEADYPFLGPLDPILGDTYHKKVNDRNSPSVNIQVARIQGFEPGDSGGPVLNQGSEVIAIADGGLEGGGSRVGWAIPYQDVRWDSVNRLNGGARLRYENLRTESIDDLFAYDDTSNDVGSVPPNLALDKAQTEKDLRRILDGTGETTWDYPSSTDGHIIFTGYETRKFVSFEKCQLTFESSIEHESEKNDSKFDDTITIDLSDATVRVVAKSQDDIGTDPGYPMGSSVVKISGTPGFKPIHEVGSSTSENLQTHETFDHTVDTTDGSWNLYFKTKEATDIAVSVLNKAIALCKLGL